MKSNNIDIIINVIDASVLERSLFLTLQLLELKIPMIIVLNKIDLLEKNKIDIDISKLRKNLNTNIISVSASSGKGLNNILDEILKYKKNTYLNENIKVDKFNYIDKIIKECVIKKEKKFDFTDQIDKIVLNKLFRNSNIFNYNVFYFLFNFFIRRYSKRIVRKFIFNIFK